jgi:phage N-6-adenine-methyltransferase
VTLIGFKPTNHPQQVGKSGANDTVDERLTPEPLFRQLHAEFAFSIDVAANARNARLPRFFDLETDGLLQPWAGERVWCNPPYSALADWTRKAHLETRGGCPLVVMLLPANRTEQGWWHDYIEPFRDGRGSIETRYIRGRINFGVPGNEAGKFKTSAPFGCVLVIWRAAE